MSEIIIDTGIGNVDQTTASSIDQTTIRQGTPWEDPVSRTLASYSLGALSR